MTELRRNVYNTHKTFRFNCKCTKYLFITFCITEAYMTISLIQHTSKTFVTVNSCLVFFQHIQKISLSGKHTVMHV